MRDSTGRSLSWEIFRQQLLLKPPILVVPRFHTNLVGWAEALNWAQIPVRVLVFRTSPLEEHKHISLRKLSGFVPRLPQSREQDDWFRSRWFLPSILDTWRGMTGAARMTLIVRDRTIMSVVAFFLYRIRGGSAAYLYVQEQNPGPGRNPAADDGRFWNFLQRKLEAGFLPSRAISPIWPIQDGFSYGKNFPFLVENRFFEVGQERLAAPWGNRQPNILIVGKYRPYKKLAELVEWIVENRPLLTSINCVTVVGECLSESEMSYRDKLYRYLKQHRLGSKIKLLANVPHSRMHEIYQENDIFLLSSPKEVASIAVLEAAASALAVLTPRSNGTSCYFSDFPELIFNWENKADLSQRLLKLLNRPGDLQMHRRRSFMAVQEICSTGGENQ